MWLCLKLYLYKYCVIILILFKDGLLNAAVFKAVIIYVVYNYIVIV